MNKKIFAWATYDWANSVFFTTVVAGFFPIFFKKYWNTEATVLQSTERLGILLAIAGFTLATLSPLLGVISDYRRSKKKFLFFFMIIGVIANASLFWVPQGDWLSAAVCYGVAFFCCSASCVFYDSLMSAVARPEQYDKVSSLGYSMGYLAGAIVLTINVLMFQKPELFGFADAVEGVKYSFLSVSVWWFMFTFPLILMVPEPELNVQKDSIFKLLRKSVRELNHTFLDLAKDRNILFFIIAYWFYIDGVSTVISMAVDFGISLGFEAGDLIKALLITQFVGFPAAYGAGILASKWSSKAIIMVCLFVYLSFLIVASVMSQSWHFYLMALMIGLSQGAVQALSRSTFAYLTPADKSGEYFGFFNLLGRFASVIGPLLIASTSRIVSDPRKTILSLSILFIFGLYFLSKVKITNKT